MIVADFIATDGTEVSVKTCDHITGSVVFYGKAVGAGIEIDAEPAVVGGVGGRVGCTDDVVADNRPWLVGQRVDTTGIVELSGIVGDFITHDAVVLHAGVEGCPSPADADARVADAAHEVVADGAVAHITQCDGNGSPVFVGDIDDGVIFDSQPLAALGQIGIGTVDLAGALCKGTTHDGCAANVAEGAILHRAVADVVDKVQGSGGQIFEYHRVEVYMMGVTYGDSTHGALYPGLVLETFVPG